MKFWVTEEEKRLIDEKMAQLPTKRYGAYLRKMAIDGYIIQVDTTDIKEMTKALGSIGRNINQIAKRVNAGGGAYKADMREIQERLDEIGGVLPHPFQHILDVGAVDLQKPGLHHLGGVVIPGDTDHLSVGADGIHHEFHQLVQTVPVQLFILGEDIVVDVLKNDLPVALALPHPVLSDPAFFSGGSSVPPNGSTLFRRRKYVFSRVCKSWYE